jgi:hypothetical protein
MKYTPGSMVNTCPASITARVAQEGVVGARLHQRAAHVVALEPQRVPEPVRVEGPRQPRGHGLLAAATSPPPTRNMSPRARVRAVVQGLVPGPTRTAAQSRPLQRLDARHQRAETRRRRPLASRTHVRVMSEQ